MGALWCQPAIFLENFAQRRMRQGDDAITNEIYYGNDNIASRPLVNPGILADATLYPTPEIEARLFRASEASAATERIRTRTWTRVKTAK
ncbi:MAG: hypothetical protein NVS9B2_29030 [Steroidobacteraceae bacterium]